MIDPDARSRSARRSWFHRHRWPAARGRTRLCLYAALPGCHGRTAPREREQAKGLVTGNGWCLSKHAASVWSTQPFAGERLASDRQGPRPSERFDTTPLEPVSRSGSGTVETYSVLYDRDQTPTRGIVLGRYDNGERFVANTPTEGLSEFVAEEQIGRRGTVIAGAGVARFDPA